MNKTYCSKYRIVRYITLAAFLLVMCSCTGDENIKVGILTELTGSAADIGTAGRDGALLAVEEANGRGGIHGKKLDMLIRNIDEVEAETRRTVKELAASGVSAIIGPATSSSALVIVPEINRFKIPTISPTASTGLLAEKDDFFFRIMPVSAGSAVKTAEYAYTKKGLRNLLVVYDKGNNGYTEPWYRALKSSFESFAQGRVEGIGYVSASGFDFLSLVRRAIGHEMDGLVVLASSIDTALFCQQLAKLNVRKPVFSCEWALTDELVEFGGKAVEGVEIFHSFDLNSSVDSYLEFSLKFQKRFGYSADFASAYGYNAMNVLLQSLTKRALSSPQQLKENILNGVPYNGVQREIYFDIYGDADREFILQTIQNGRIVTI